MTAAATQRPIAKGDQVTPLELNLTPTKIVAGAIASRDFMPAHHDPEFVKSQGAPDIFLNILSTNGYVSRFITDWAGPEAMVRSIKIRLGVPAVPGKLLRFTGEVVSTSHEGDEGVVEVSMRAANDLGDHATGTVVVFLPRSMVAA
jgi:acyl dehydratase